MGCIWVLYFTIERLCTMANFKEEGKMDMVLKLIWRTLIIYVCGKELFPMGKRQGTSSSFLTKYNTMVPW